MSLPFCVRGCPCAVGPWVDPSWLGNRPVAPPVFGKVEFHSIACMSPVARSSAGSRSGRIGREFGCRGRTRGSSAPAGGVLHCRSLTARPGTHRLIRSGRVSPLRRGALQVETRGLSRTFPNLESARPTRRPGPSSIRKTSARASRRDLRRRRTDVDWLCNDPGQSSETRGCIREHLDRITGPELFDRPPLRDQGHVG
jgi:hypothetical protein